MDTKTCGKCGLVKPLLGFSTTKSKKSGYHHWCKMCANVYNKKRNQRLYTEAFVRSETTLRDNIRMLPSNVYSSKRCLCYMWST